MYDEDTMIHDGELDEVMDMGDEETDEEIDDEEENDEEDDM